jgi:DNA helicase HerA-like ATPase
MHGQFLLVQLETPDEAVLGRIAAFSSEGKLSHGVGEEFNLRAVREDRPIPEDLREQYLKYRVNIRVLGVVRQSGTGLNFVASQRRLPHVGSPVAFPSDAVLQEIAGHNIPGAKIGHLALGEYVYAAGSKDIATEDWMQVRSPEVLAKFPIESLVSRRSFIFARAGFGKSNLNKFLFSRLYATTPTVTKRGGREVPVGTVIFDPDGEYFWPDDKGRPGLADVPELQDKLVVFTSREGPSAFYQSFVAGGIKLDIRQLRPSDVIAIALGPERQDQQNVRKLRGLNSQRWQDLVNLIDEDGNAANLARISEILDLDSRQDVEALAARSNMTAIVRMLHDKSSQLMDKLLYSLSEGKLCVVDVSQLRGGPALVLSGLILHRIFDRNQQEFTKAISQTIPTIAVVEEAQSVLNARASAADPYVAWVKEGRKYDLGAVLITQQPGSIPDEILSQGDNWFIFHLLSAHDLNSVQKANAHFSQDILSVLLNEPIPGHCVFWSSVGGKPYPVSLRVLSFEHLYKVRDAEYNKPAVKTFATEVRHKFAGVLGMLSAAINNSDNGHEETADADPLTAYEEVCCQALAADGNLLNRINSEIGIPWKGLMEFFKRYLPEYLDNVDEVAFNLVPKVLTRLYEQRDQQWESYKRPGTASSKSVTYIRTKSANV